MGTLVCEELVTGEDDAEDGVEDDIRNEVADDVDNGVELGVGVIELKCKLVLEDACMIVEDIDPVEEVRPGLVENTACVEDDSVAREDMLVGERKRLVDDLDVLVNRGGSSVEVLRSLVGSCVLDVDA